MAAVLQEAVAVAQIRELRQRCCIGRWRWRCIGSCGSGTASGGRSGGSASGGRGGGAASGAAWAEEPAGGHGGGAASGGCGDGLGMSGQLAVRWRLRMVQGAHVCGLRRSSSSPVSVLSASPSMWRSGGAHGDLRRFSVGFGLCCPLRVDGYGLAMRLLNGCRWWFVLVLVGGCEVLELFAERKLCLGGRPGPTTVMHVGAAYFLKASSKRVFLVLHKTK
nr:rRNA 2'-O-methyltransferase fibrillarin 2-like [Lolium perenne]